MKQKWNYRKIRLNVGLRKSELMADPEQSHIIKKRREKEGKRKWNGKIENK